MSRDLLENATPRPWRVIAQLSASDPPFIRAADDKTVVSGARSEDHAALIVAAVNEYEALLDLEEAVRAMRRNAQDEAGFGPTPVNRALTNLDAIRTA